MAKGLDVGAMNVLSVSQGGSETVFVQQYDSFVEVDYSDMAEQMLSRSDVFHVRKGDEVYVVGDDAFNFANIFGKETWRPTQHGVLSSEESSAISAIKPVVERAVGLLSQPNEHLFYSSLADPVDSDLSTLYHNKTLKSMLSDMGYSPEPINERMAIVYSGFANGSFIGLDALFDAGMANVYLTYYMVPVMRFSIAHNDNWIDQQVIQATGTTIDKITSIRENGPQLNFRMDVGGIRGALSVYYRNPLDYVIGNIRHKVDEGDIEEGLDVPIVVTGGTPSPEGSEELFEHHLEDSVIPFPVNEVRNVDHPLYSVIHGLLVAARSEEESDGGAFDPESEAEIALESN